MDMNQPSTLVKLSEISQTVADRADDIRGRKVRDRDGEEIGTIKDLLVDESEGRVRFMEVASGGFLGIGRDTTLVPIEAIDAIGDDEVRLGHTREHVAASPVYDPDLVNDRDIYSENLSYYGYPLWWNIR